MQCPFWLCQSPILKTAALELQWLKEALNYRIESRLHQKKKNRLLIGTQLVIYAIWLWSAVRAALSTLRWNYPAITNIQLKLGAAREYLIYPARCISSTNIHPLRPLVAHLESCLKNHSRPTCYWNPQKQIVSTGVGRDIIFAFYWLNEKEFAFHLYKVIPLPK